MAMLPTTSGGSSYAVALASEQAIAAARDRHRGGARAGRPRHAVGRSRRRQDHVRPRADPPSRRRSGHRGAEPDLHADADLRPAALSAGACRPLPPGGPGRARRARLRRPAEGRRGAAGMAGPRGGLPAAGPPRRRASRWRRSSGPSTATRASPATARSRARAERIAGDPPLPRFRRASPRPSAGASRATPRRAATSG